MSVIGIETVVYCVDDVEKSVDFFEDFGLSIYEQSEAQTRFRLPDHSNVIVRSRDRFPVPGSKIEGIGVHEVIWGVDNRRDLERLVARLGTDRPVTRDEDGSAHFIADGGLPMGLRHWEDYRVVRTSVDPINSPGNINRLNAHRRWIARAFPKRLFHVVFLVPDRDLCKDFLINRLDFRLSDTQRGIGVYLHCDGTTDHHNIYLADSSSALVGAPGGTRFHHLNFDVTDLDEMMVGMNYMAQRGWPRSVWGLGRHRISSALFYYLPCPAGGDAEYGADGDQIDENWVPRDWDALFGFAHWVANIPEYMLQGQDWSVGFIEGMVPSHGHISPREYNRPSGRSAHETTG